MRTICKMQVNLQSAETKSLLFINPWIRENVASATLRHQLGLSHGHESVTLTGSRVPDASLSFAKLGDAKRSRTPLWLARP
jgi:hypothetical protein